MEKFSRLTEQGKKMIRKTLVILLLMLSLSGLWDPCFAQKVYLKNRASLSADYDDNVYKASRDQEGDFLGRLYYDFKLNYFPTTNNLLSFNYQHNQS